MWAMIPMLRQRSNGTVRGIYFLAFKSLLPPVMREGLVGFRHAVDVFFLLHGRAFSVRGIEQFIRQLVGHALFAALTAVTNEPANGERGPAIGIHLDWHLVVRAADAPGLHFEQRLYVFDRLLEQLDRL